MCADMTPQSDHRLTDTMDAKILRAVRDAAQVLPSHPRVIRWICAKEATSSRVRLLQSATARRRCFLSN